MGTFGQPELPAGNLESKLEEKGFARLLKPTNQAYDSEPGRVSRNARHGLGRPTTTCPG